MVRYSVAMVVDMAADIAVGIWYITCVGRLRQFVATSRVGLLLSCPGGYR